MSEQSGNVTEADVTAFAMALDGWRQTLSPRDQALLQRILHRAASVPDDSDSVAWAAQPPVGWAYVVPNSLAPQVSASLGLTAG